MGLFLLSKANAYLKTLNAQLEETGIKMSPEARAAAGVTDGRISSMEDAANGLRQEMYSKFKQPWIETGSCWACSQRIRRFKTSTERVW